MLRRLLDWLRRLLRKDAENDLGQAHATVADAQNPIDPVVPVVELSPAEEVQDQPDVLSRTHYVQCVSTSGLHQMAYHEWGDPNNSQIGRAHV